MNLSKVSLLLAFVLLCFSSFSQRLKKSEAASISEKYLQTAIAAYQRVAKAEWESKLIKYDTFQMKFDYKIFGTAPFGKRSLYISLHGGGNTAPRVNDQQWENQKRLYTPAEGVYLAPRAPTNTWNLWHEEHIDAIFEKLIKDAIVFEGVDPNKIYLLGYSAGGDGLFQLAPRMADHWAAASMMAGHPGDASALPLRNLPFAIFMGGKDAAYDRNKHAATWGKLLDSLQKTDPGYYTHSVHIFDTLGHWMQRKDSIAIPWMAAFTRNPIPAKTIWVQDDRLHDDFYYLGTDKASSKTGDKAIVSINKASNEIIIDENSFTNLIIYLNDDMLNLDKKITVVAAGKRVFSGNVSRSEKMIRESIEKSLDRNRVFSAALKVTTAGVNPL